MTGGNEIAMSETPNRAASAGRLRRAAAFLPDVLLIALIGVGVVFRFSWTDWSEGTNLAPDEYGLTNTLTQIEMPKSPDEWFNTRLSPISPYQKYDVEGRATAPGPDQGMVWGQWPQILIRGTAEGLNSLQAFVGSAFYGCETPAGSIVPAVCGNYQPVNHTGYNQLRLLGRTLSALADTITLLVLLWIGWRLYSRRIALLAAALSALAVMQIQQSHFMTVDNFVVVFAVLAVACAVAVAQKGRWGWYALFGVFYGMALASKINVAPLGAIIAMAAWMGNRERWRDAALRPIARFSPALVGMALAVGFTLLTFRVTQPMSFRATTGDTGFFTLSINPDWMERMQYAQSLSSGIGWAGYPPADQWAGRLPVLYPLMNMVLWGLGLPLGLAGLAGVGWAVLRIWRVRDWERHLLPVLTVVGLFLFLGTRGVTSVRYFLVLYPFVCLLAAWALDEFWRSTANRGRMLRTLSIAATGLVVIGTFAWAWGFTSIYRHENTRVAASRWIYQNVPGPFNLDLRLSSGDIYRDPIPFYYDSSIGVQGLTLQFIPRESGAVERLTVGFARDESGAEGSILRVELESLAEESVLATADLEIPPVGSDPRGTPLTAQMDGIALTAGHTYALHVSALRGGPITVQGSTIADESWDEALPQRIDARDGFGGLYHGITMDMQWPDVAEKLDMIVASLDESDYVVLPSQRRIWTSIRLPAAYPLTTEYYRALFDGRLGFDLAAEFQSPITIGPLKVSDLAATAAWGRAPGLPVANLNPLAAEEAFSVYDHAPVWIFRKRADFSADQARAVLSAIDLTQVGKQDASQGQGILNGLMLTPEQDAEQQAGGTWSEMFSYETLWNRYPGIAVFLWWLWALLTGWAAFPFVRRVFRGLPDEGYSLAKITGWLLVAWVVWWLAHTQVPFSFPTIALAWTVLLAAGAVMAWRDRDDLKASFQTRKRTWLTMEAVFLGFFLFDILLRLAYGDLWQLWTGGEKPMDFSYLNAVIRSTVFPPYDPWFSGGYMNYYYFGYVLAAVPIKLLATVPAIGYNIVVPLFFATLGMTTYGVAWNLTESLRRKRDLRISPVFAGLAAAILLMVLGNLGEVRMVWEALVSASQIPIPRGLLFGLGDVVHALGGAARMLVGQASMPYNISDWYWKATRAIQFPPGPEGQYLTDNAITEFPYFTFLLADLHAHLMVMPMILLALGGSAAMIIAPDRLRRWSTALPLIGVTALAIGSLWPTNSWNYPVSLVIALLGLALAGWRMLSGSTGLKDIRGWIRILLLGGLLIGLTIWLFEPFYQNFGFGYTKVELWPGIELADGSVLRTPVESYLVIHGLFLFILATYLVRQTRDALAGLNMDDIRKTRDLFGWIGMGIAVLVLLEILLAVSGYAVLVLVVPLIVWAILLGLRNGVDDEHRMLLALTAIGLGVTGVVEIVVLSGDIGRQNTVFKFYLQAWLLFALAGGVALAWLAGDLPRWSRGLRRIWIVLLGLLVAGASFYTVEASYARITDRASDIAPRTLDGMEFMKTTFYYFVDDYGQGEYNLLETYDAIRWMQENIAGSPVIVQCPWPHYRGGLPYTMFTGLPSVIGWNFHERQQRGVVSDEWVWQRDREVEIFYQTTDLAEAREFLRRYDVRYIVVGQNEIAYYPEDGLAKFSVLEQGGEIRTVFSEGRTVVYEVADLEE
jgi:YYY domain-containing protein